MKQKAYAKFPCSIKTGNTRTDMWLVWESILAIKEIQIPYENHAQDIWLSYIELIYYKNIVFYKMSNEPSLCKQCSEKAAEFAW